MNVSIVAIALSLTELASYRMVESIVQEYNTYRIAGNFRMEKISKTHNGFQKYFSKGSVFLLCSDFALVAVLWISKSFISKMFLDGEFPKI